MCGIATHVQNVVLLLFFVKDTIKEQGKKKLSAGGSREFLNMTEIEKSYRF